MIYIKTWQESHTSLKCNVEPKKVVAIIDKVNRWWRKRVGSFRGIAHKSD